MKSYKLKATLVIGIIFVSALPVAFAQDNAVPNQVTSPYSASDLNGAGVLAPTAPIYQLGSGSTDNNSCANGNCVLAPSNSSSQSNPGNSSSQSNPGNSSSQSNPGGTFTLKSPLDPKVTSIGGLVQTFIDVISYILILFAVLMLVYTGLQYILAQGNSEKIKELHGKLLWIVVGVAIVIGARVIIEVVINTLSAAHVINSSTFNQVQSAATGK